MIKLNNFQQRWTFFYVFTEAQNRPANGNGKTRVDVRQIETHFIIVLHDCAFEFGCIYPGYKVFHVSVPLDKKLSEMVERRELPCYQKGRVCDGIRANTNVTLLYEFDGLLGNERRKDKRTGQRHTALTVSDIFDIHINTANLLRQKAATVSLFSISLNFADVLRTPMS